MKDETVKTLQQFNGLLKKSAAAKYVKHTLASTNSRDPHFIQHFYSIHSPQTGNRRTFFEFAENSPEQGGIIPEHQIYILCIPVLKRIVGVNGVKSLGGGDTIVKNHYSVKTFLNEIEHIITSLEEESYKITRSKSKAKKFTQHVLYFFAGVLLANPKYINIVRYASLEDLYAFYQHNIPDRMMHIIYDKQYFDPVTKKPAMTAEECAQYSDMPFEWFEEIIKR
jgi:hypothetical protein